MNGVEMTIALCKYICQINLFETDSFDTCDARCRSFITVNHWPYIDENSNNDPVMKVYCDSAYERIGSVKNHETLLEFLNVSNDKAEPLKEELKRKAQAARAKPTSGKSGRYLALDYHYLRLLTKISLAEIKNKFHKLLKL